MSYVAFFSLAMLTSRMEQIVLMGLLCSGLWRRNVLVIEDRVSRGIESFYRRVAEERLRAVSLFLEDPALGNKSLACSQ